MLRIVHDLPDAEYRSAEGLTQSAISQLLECPRLYHESLRFPREISPAMRLGVLVHTMVLQPALLDTLFAFFSRPATTKEGKAQRAAALARGLIPASSAEHDEAAAIATALRDSEPAATLLTRLPGASEVSVFWQHRLHGNGGELQAKGRVDRLIDLGGGEWLALDLKTTSSGCSPHAVSKKIAQLHYYRQAAWYLEGLAANGISPCRFIFIFVTTTPPYLSTCVTLSSDALELGRDECERGARLYHEGLTTNSWPSYASKIIEIDLPPWSYNRGGI